MKILIDYVSEVRQIISQDQDFGFNSFSSLLIGSQFQISAGGSKCVCSQKCKWTEQPKTSASKAQVEWKLHGEQDRREMSGDSAKCFDSVGEAVYTGYTFHEEEGRLWIHPSDTNVYL